MNEDTKIDKVGFTKVLYHRAKIKIVTVLPLIGYM